MDTVKARQILEDAYKDDYISPLCKNCETGPLIGDVLVHSTEREQAAQLLNVFIQVARVTEPADGEVLVVKHDPALSPVESCGHGDDCCMKKNTPALH